MAVETEGMSLAELVFALKARGARIPFEIGAFVALEACEQVMARPGLVKPHLVHVAADGTVHVAALAVADENAAAKAMVDLLAHVLVAAGAGVPPTLVAFIEGATPEGSRGLSRVRAELRAALMPLNRQASRRVLSRLIRESRRLGVGAVTPAPLALATPAPADVEMAAELDALVGDVSPRRAVHGVFESGKGRVQPTDPSTPSSAGVVQAAVPRTVSPAQRATAAFTTAAGTTAAGITSPGITSPGTVADPGTTSAQTRVPGEQRSYRPPPPSSFGGVLEDTLSDHEAQQTEGAGPWGDVVEAPEKPSRLPAASTEGAPPPNHGIARTQVAQAAAPAHDVVGTLGGVGEMAARDVVSVGPRRHLASSGALEVRPYAEAPASAAMARVASARVPAVTNAMGASDLSAASSRASTDSMVGAYSSELLPPQATPPWRSHRLALAVTAGVVGTLVAGLVVGPGWLMDVLGRVSAAPTASEVSAAEVASSGEASRRGHGALTINVHVPDAQVLRYVGRGPLTIADLPTGVAHEFVAFEKGYRATRALLPAATDWEASGESLRSELALQLAPTEDSGERVGVSLMPERVGEASGRYGELRIVSNPRGAKVYQLIGFAPKVRVRGIRTDQAHELLIVRDGYAPEKLVIGPSDWAQGEEGPTAELDVQLEPK